MPKKRLSKKVVEISRIGFELAWKLSTSSIELSSPTINADGIEYRAELFDPLSGTIVGKYSFTWDEIEEVVKHPKDASWIHEAVSEHISFEGEAFGESELVVDDDGRVHFRSDLEDL